MDAKDPFFPSQLKACLWSYESLWVFLRVQDNLLFINNQKAEILMCCSAAENERNVYFWKYNHMLFFFFFNLQLIVKKDCLEAYILFSLFSLPCCAFIMCQSQITPVKWKQSISPCSVSCEEWTLIGGCIGCTGPLRDGSFSR